jgi:acetyl-CoA acetyltransferase family protein
MESAVIVDAVRTPLGVRNGLLSGWHPADLAAAVLDTLATRNELDPALVDDVIMGCVTQVGAQAVNVGRNAVLAAGWPESVPATTIDRQCGSSLQSVHFAAQGVMAGAYDVVVAAGVEVMSLVPLGASVAVQNVGQPFPASMHNRYGAAGGLQPQGVAAELIASGWNLDRERLDAYALNSQERAARAVAQNRFGAEIVAVPGKILDREGHRVVDTGQLVQTDGGIRPTTAEGLAALKPAFQADGVVTAGNSAQISDGAAGVLIMSETKATTLGLPVRARCHSFAVIGVDPVTMLTGSIPATARVLTRAGMAIDDIDVFEVHEAFASVVLAWMSEHHADPERVNPNGGAIALGHPVGCSGARIVTTLINELERRGGRYGLATMSEAGGTANALVVECPRAS